jgi:pyruvate formate lyase activating enzyme
MSYREASFYKKLNGKVNCNLCPHNCVIKDGNTGTCNVRRNTGGQLISENFGVLSAINYDPVEKKPLYHFYPGSVILSIGSYGCNMKCKCCQNWQISQAGTENLYLRESYSAEDVLALARSRSKNIGVAYTYNEPTVWFEFMVETAVLVQGAGLKNVIVSNGFINKEPLLELLKFIDAFNIDLKAFNESFYREVSSARLEPVKDTLKTIAGHKKHLEITNLVVPTLNDSDDEFKKMVDWIAEELGPDTVLHLSRYHPMYRMDIEATGSDTLERLYNIAAGTLNYVFVGNISIKDCQDTRCSKCKKTVIRRTGYYIDRSGIDKDGKCVFCGNHIAVTE